MRRAGKSPIGEQRDRCAQTSALNRSGDGQHLAHAWPTFRAFIANHNDITSLDLSTLHSGKGVLFSVEDSSWAAVTQRFLPRNFHHAAFRSHIAFENY